MARRIDVGDVVYEMGLLELPWDVEAGRIDPVFEITAADIRALTEELNEPECAVTLAELEAALSGVQAVLSAS